MKLTFNGLMSHGLPLDHDVELAQRLGMDGLTVPVAKLEPFGVEKGLKLLADSGLPVAAATGAGMFSLDDRAKWPEQIERSKRVTDLAGRMGAECMPLLAGSGGKLSYEEAEEEFLALLDQFLPTVRDNGTRLALEPNTCLRYDLGFCHTLHDALDLAERVDSPQFGVLFEMNNAWYERHLYDNIARRFDRIFLVQIDDQPANDFCTPSRVALGDGVIPCDRILRAFEAAGYDGYYDIEVVGPALAERGHEAIITACIDYLAKL